MAYTVVYTRHVNVQYSTLYIHYIVWNKWLFFKIIQILPSAESRVGLGLWVLGWFWTKSQLNWMQVFFYLYDAKWWFYFQSVMTLSVKFKHIFLHFYRNLEGKIMSKFHSATWCLKCHSVIYKCSWPLKSETGNIELPFTGNF